MKKVIFSLAVACIFAVSSLRFAFGQDSEDEGLYGSSACDNGFSFMGKKSNEIYLCNAALDGNVEKVKNLLSRGTPVNLKGEFKGGATPLMLASEAGSQCYDSSDKRFEKHPDYIQIVKLLLAAGSDVNAEDNAGQYNPTHVTPLMYAADGRSETIIKLLIDSAAKTRKSDSNGRTALMRASRWASLNTISLLVGKGESINARNKSGYTALMAASLNSEEATRFLISKGARVDARTKGGATALMMAPSATRPAKYSRSRFTTDRQPSYETVFAEDRAKSIILLLLSHGADINAQTKLGTTPLLQAVRVGSPSVVELLLQKGANVDLNQPLGLAKRLRDDFKTTERQQIVELLENAGAKA